MIVVSFGFLYLYDISIYCVFVTYTFIQTEMSIRRDGRESEEDVSGIFTSEIWKFGIKTHICKRRM